MTKKKGEVSTFEKRKKKKAPGIAGLIAAALIVLVIAYFVVSGIKIIKLKFYFMIKKIFVKIISF